MPHKRVVANFRWMYERCVKKQPDGIRKSYGVGIAILWRGALTLTLTMHSVEAAFSELASTLRTKNKTLTSARKAIFAKHHKKNARADTPQNVRKKRMQFNTKVLCTNQHKC